MNKFRAWVVSQSDQAETARQIVAAKLDKHPRAIYYWLQGRASPTAKYLEILVKLGKGAFSYQDIIDCTVHGKK